MRSCPFELDDGDVAVLGAVALAGLAEPVVHQRQVLAAIDGPEEGVAERAAADQRRPVDRQQEAGRAVLLVDRVVQRRQVEQRHVLDLEHGVGQHRALVDGEGDGAGGHLPARRRLDAGREAALADPVAIGAELLDRLAVEERVGLLRAEEAAIDAIADRRRAEGVEEGAGAIRRVDLGAIGRDAARRRDEHDVAGGGDVMAIEVVVDDVRGEPDAAARAARARRRRSSGCARGR